MSVQRVANSQDYWIIEMLTQFPVFLSCHLLGHLILLVLAFVMVSLMLGLTTWEFASEEVIYGFLEAPLSQNLVLLTVWVVFLMSLSSSHQQLMSAPYVRMFVVLMLILTMTFKINAILGFYYLFETALIPIFLMIMGWGYQPERLSAGINMFLYTVLASLPLLLCFLPLSFSLFSPNFTDLSKLSLLGGLENFTNSGLTIALLAGLMVKYPIYSVHLWLPKAHVEAPVAGSMILAALLLKLGGYGLIRLSPLISTSSGASGSLSMFALMGGAVISVLCLRQVDMKILIAYSSVAHMSLAISATLSQTLMGLTGAYIMLIAHGVASSGLFSAAMVVYSRWKTRNMLLSKSLLNYAPIFSMWWFLLCLGNMGAPPSLNLLSEVMAILALANSSKLFMLPVAATAAYAVAYTLILYSSTQQGQISPSKPQAPPLTFRENSTLGSHVLNILLLALVASMLC